MSVRFPILALTLAVTIQADTLRMRDGTTINGSFVGGTQDDVRFMINDEVRHFARANVAAIVFNSLTTGGTSAPTRDAAPAAVGPVDNGPDYVGAPFLRGSNGYIPLEREAAMMARSGGMYGMGGTVYRIQGARSPVRVRQGDRIVFVVRLNRGDDPRQFQLYHLDSRMGYRQTQPTMGGSPPGLQVTIHKVSDTVYEILPVRVLYPGEYAISPMNSNDSYCFGVDY